MRYEIVHDTLARQILDRVSGQAKARRRAELLVARAYERYQVRGVLLTQDDLDEIRMHEQAINFSPQEKVFIQNSKNALERAAQRKRRILIGVISLLSLFLLFAMWQWQRALASTRALEAKAAYDAGWTSQAFHLAQKAYSPFASENTLATIDEVLAKISASGLERDLMHDHKVTGLDLSPSDKLILSTTEAKTAYLWDLNGNLRATMKHAVPVITGRFLPWDGAIQVITIAEDSTAYFWDDSGHLIRQHQHNEKIKGLDFNTKYQLTLLWGANEVVLLANDGERWPFKSPHQGLLQVSFSPNNNDLLLATNDLVSSWWLELVKIGRAQARFTIPGAIQWADYIASDHIQQQVLVQFQNGSSRVFDSTGQPDTSTYYQFLNRELAAIPPVTRFVFSSPGHNHPKTLFQTDSTSIRYWSAYRKHTDQERAGNLDFYTRYDSPITGVDFSSSDQYLLTASADGRVDIWKIDAPAAKRFRRFRAQIRSVHFTQDDRYLISTAKDHTIKVWNLGEVKTPDTRQLIDHYKNRIATQKK